MKDWVTEARRKGWPDREIEILANLLKDRRGTTTITAVSAWVISVRSDLVLEFSGVGRDGQTVVHNVPFVRNWQWRRHPMPITTIFEGEKPSEWCPVHGNQCARSTRGCTRNHEQRLVHIEMASININPRVRKDPQLPTSPPSPPLIEASASVSAPIRKRPSKPKKGSPLPGQITLGLGPSKR